MDGRPVREERHLQYGELFLLGQREIAGPERGRVDLGRNVPDTGGGM